MTRTVILAVTTVLMLLGPTARAETAVARGEYFARIMDCGGCHTYGALAGQPDMARYMAGSDIGFEMPGFGIFYPPNLTPDADTGLGAWSAEDISNAVRGGLRPDGRELAPIMPWHAYAALTDDDMAALAAYLKSLPPYSFKVPGPFGPSETPTAPFLRVVVPQ